MNAYRLALFGWSADRQLLPADKWRAAVRWLSGELGVDPRKAPIAKYLAADEGLIGKFMEMIG